MIAAGDIAFRGYSGEHGKRCKMTHTNDKDVIRVFPVQSSFAAMTRSDDNQPMRCPTSAGRCPRFAYQTARVQRI